MERFWSKVKKGNKNQCWNWQANKRGGYGRFRMGDKIVTASRLAFQLKEGAIPKGLFVLHTCDNSICCNPGHLYLGTKQDNADDKVARGRCARASNKGEKHGLSKFTEKDVIKIKKLYATGKFRQEDLAKKYGVQRRAIGRVIDGTRWGHIGS